MNKELELEVEKLYPVNNTGSMFMANREQINNSYKQEGFIAGATSKYVEKQKLEFAIEQLNKLDSVLQSKIETLETVFGYYSDSKEYYRIRMSGVQLAKEEVIKDIKELEQKLSEL